MSFKNQIVAQQINNKRKPGQSYHLIAVLVERSDFKGELVPFSTEERRTMSDKVRLSLKQNLIKKVLKNQT